MSSAHLLPASTLTAVSHRVIALTRVALALLSLFVVFAQTPEVGTIPALEHTVALIYVAFAFAVYALALRRAVPIRAGVEHWIDGIYIVLAVITTGGVSSPIFFLLLFPILVAAFRGGRPAGLLVTSYLIVVSAFMVALVAPPEMGLFLRLSRPLGLLIFGLFLSYWGSHMIKLRHRLSVSREITKLANPRFGVSALIGASMKRLLTLYDARSCLLVVAEPGTDKYFLYRVTRRDLSREVRPEEITTGLSSKLLRLPEGTAVIYGPGQRMWLIPWTHFHCFDITTDDRESVARREAASLADVLDSAAYLTVPVRFNSVVVGRLFLLTERCRFDRSDAQFIIQIIDQVTPVLENIRLIDQLATVAAEEERKKIARDIHDSVIQPYVGLQLGLTGVRRKLSAGEREVEKDIDALMEIVSGEVVNLRGYVRGLKEGGQRPDNLLPAVRRFAKKFSETTGIQVRVLADEGLSLNDRLAGEVFQMVAEGLSNVRRHTTSQRATIVLSRQDELLNLRIQNDGANGAVPPDFIPRSLTERARSLGGDVHVRNQSGITIVDIHVYL